ncbi:hypothetical protein [Celeribacter litoreus]|uniref:hypothetical protein n=1 Tax=Celeribacter litoreus TaxID=2876714 RepID=UPI001CCE86CD|nr:hypothetical protein [Celeribacter litoreus]MCA0045229.1 hypothetical protein [Celeribacter litoreus]
MSAPDTNLETQEKQHKVPLIGIISAVLVGLLMLFGVMNLAFDDESTEPSPVVTEGDASPIAE